jgi:hypothetical protein
VSQSVLFYASRQVAAVMIYLCFCDCLLLCHSNIVIVPDYEKLGSRCRLSRAHNQSGDALRGWEFGMGREWGGQFTSNLGPRWTGSHHTRGGIPSK